MYYKDPNTNSVYFYESPEFAKPGLISISDTEAIALANRIDEATLLENKAKAISLLSETDWVEFPSVTNPLLTPQLLNVGDFNAYRSWLRVMAIQPISGDLSWPVKPTAQWKM